MRDRLAHLFRVDGGKERIGAQMKAKTVGLALDVFIEGLGLPTRLREVNVKQMKESVEMSPELQNGRAAAPPPKIRNAELISPPNTLKEKVGSGEFGVLEIEFYEAAKP